MSGRTRWRRPTGELVIGYRKTGRRNPRLRHRSAVPPEWRLTFDLPAHIAAFTRPGRVRGFVGVTVRKDGTVECAGQDRRWLIGQAYAFLREIAMGNEYSVDVTMSADGVPPRRSTFPVHPHRVRRAAGEADSHG